ncbi:MAG: hypothetical protein NXI31_16380 [bacterium]|nr:hypothetical protein [bacterium]
MTVPRQCRDVPANGSENGFALLVMFAIVGTASLGIVLAVGLLAPIADADARSEQHVATAEAAARDQFRASGAFGATMDDLVNASHGRVGGPWRVDPWGSGQDLDYGFVGSSLRLRARGADRTLGTADDVTATISAEDLVRARQRARLRLIRAVLTRSSYRWAATMTNPEEAQMRQAMRDYAIARRAWLTADAPTRATLTNTMTTAAATVSSLASAHGCTPLPLAVTGAGGLMQGLGMADGRAIDGLGAALLPDATLGVIARGADGTGGTDDDM